MWASAVKLKKKRTKPHWKQGFIDKKFSLAIIPTSLLHALVCLLPVFLFCLPLVSPDSFLCPLSAQVSSISSEQWPIVFYWAALPLLLPSIYLPRSFFSSAHSFPFHCLPTSGRTGGWNGKKWRKEATKKEVEGFRVLCETVKEREKKEIDKLAKEDRRWRETWNIGKWRTARWLLENGGLDIE